MTREHVPLMQSATYRLLDGGTITLEYDANAPCHVCGKPVVAASMGGTNLCPWCDMGVHRNGRKWTYQEMLGLVGKVKAGEP